MNYNVTLDIPLKITKCYASRQFISNEALINEMPLSVIVQ